MTWDDDAVIEKMLENPRWHVIEMVTRPGGATIHEICAELGWLAHTSRGFISRLSRDGVEISSRPSAGGRRYEAALTQEEMIEF